jgi:hypothetical protein
MKAGTGIRCALAATLALALTGCFTMHHKFPPNTQFGRRPDGVVDVRPVADKRMKNYLLSGLFPYSSFGTKDMAKDPGEGRELADVEIESQFNAFDFIVTLVPGACCYGYYIWAPRHVGYQGMVVESSREPVAVQR